LADKFAKACGMHDMMMAIGDPLVGQEEVMRLDRRDS
jgi:hypothetical protein